MQLELCCAVGNYAMQLATMLCSWRLCYSVGDYARLYYAVGNYAMHLANMLSLAIECTQLRSQQHMDCR